MDDNFIGFFVGFMISVILLSAFFWIPFSSSYGETMFCKALAHSYTNLTSEADFSYEDGYCFAKDKGYSRSTYTLDTYKLSNYEMNMIGEYSG